MREIPSIGAAAYTTTTYNPASLGLIANQQGFGALAAQGQSPLDNLYRPDTQGAMEREQRIFHSDVREKEVLIMANKPLRRLVQVIIVDGDENVPLADCLLYKGEPKFT